MADGGREQVLITRPVAESEATARLVRERGFEAVIAPLLEVERRVVDVPAGAMAILFTSGNAVAAVRSGFDRAVFAVGDATAGRARAAGFVDVTSAGGTGPDLVALVRARCPAGAGVLFVSGEQRGMEVVAGLRLAGFKVSRRVGYAARPVRALPEAAVASLTGGRLRSALFLSAETARAFARLIPRDLQGSLGNVEALAIGAAAAEALALLPWRRVRVSVGPTLEQVLALL